MDQKLAEMERQKALLEQMKDAMDEDEFMKSEQAKSMERMMEKQAEEAERMKQELIEKEKEIARVKEEEAKKRLQAEKEMERKQAEQDAKNPLEAVPKDAGGGGGMAAMFKKKKAAVVEEKKDGEFPFRRQRMRKYGVEVRCRQLVFGSVALHLIAEVIKVPQNLRFDDLNHELLMCWCTLSKAGLCG